MQFNLTIKNESRKINGKKRNPEKLKLKKLNLKKNKTEFWKKNKTDFTGPNKYQWHPVILIISYEYKFVNKTWFPI